MQYFDTVFKKEPMKYEFDFPIFLNETAIIRDIVDNKILLRNIFTNIGNSDIVAIEIVGVLKDIFGNPIIYKGCDNFSYIYQDVVIKQGETFGNTIAIDLPLEARKAEINVTRLVLIDGRVLESKKENIVTLQKQQEINEPDDFIQTIDKSYETILYYFVENEECWQCTCGSINKKSDLKCKCCNREKVFLETHLLESEMKKEYALFCNEKAARLAEEQRLLKLQKETEEQQAVDSQTKIGAPELGGNTSFDFLENNGVQKSRASKMFKKTILLICTVGICVIAGTMCFLSKSDKKQMDNTTKSLEPYIAEIGKKTNDGLVTNSQEFVNGLDDVAIMNRIGTVSHAFTANSGDEIAIMNWVDHKTATQNDYEKFITFLNDFYNQKAESKCYENISKNECKVWSDEINQCLVISWLEDDYIHMRWYGNDYV